MKNTHLVLVIAVPGLRDWGSGLEQLTECYLKYKRHYLVEAGRVFQQKKDIHNHLTVKRSTYPKDIDLIAVNPTLREVALVSCKEIWEEKPEETLEEFKEYENFIRTSDELGYKNAEIIFSKKIACVNISKNKKSVFQLSGVEILDVFFMIDELKGYLGKVSEEQLKGAHREPIIWLLQTMQKHQATKEKNALHQKTKRVLG